jgi:hypothetical protein
VRSVILGAGLPPPESPEAVLRAYATSPHSNFEFLIRLNLACGRTFNSLSSYRFFPSFLNRFDDRSTCRDITNTPAQSRPDPDRVGGHLPARCSSLLFSGTALSVCLRFGRSTSSSQRSRVGRTSSRSGRRPGSSLSTSTGSSSSSPRSPQAVAGTKSGHPMVHGSVFCVKQTSRENGLDRIGKDITRTTDGAASSPSGKSTKESKFQRM